MNFVINHALGSGSIARPVTSSPVRYHRTYHGCLLLFTYLLTYLLKEDLLKEDEDDTHVAQDAERTHECHVHADQVVVVVRQVRDVKLLPVGMDPVDLKKRSRIFEKFVTHISIHLPIYLSNTISICLSAYLSIYLSLSLSQIIVPHK